MPSSSVSKRFVLVLNWAVVAIQLLLIGNVSSINQTNVYLYHKCSEIAGKYKQKSPYGENLNFLISDMYKDTFVRGFVYAYHGDDPNTVYILLQCRGDSYGSKCGTCLTTAISEVTSNTRQYFCLTQKLPKTIQLSLGKLIFGF